jgi:guanylate kinase
VTVAGPAVYGRPRQTPVPVRLTVLSGPSGVGKSTVVARLRELRPQIWQSVSVTTRPPRPGEIDGREYFFVSDAEFDAMAAGGKLLEWAQFAGNKYGTPRTAVTERLDAGIATLLEIDVAGAPSWDELVRRLTGRETEPPEVINQRLAAARLELAAGHEFDITLVNTSVDDVCDQLVALMMIQGADRLLGGAARRRALLVE